MARCIDIGNMSPELFKVADETQPKKPSQVQSRKAS